MRLDAASSAFLCLLLFGCGDLQGPKGEPGRKERLARKARQAFQVHRARKARKVTKVTKANQVILGAQAFAYFSQLNLVQPLPARTTR
jgi:hypothetical protein